MGEGDGGGGELNREGGLINFPPVKRGGLLEMGGLFERGGLKEDLRYDRKQVEESPSRILLLTHK